MIDVVGKDKLILARCAACRSQCDVSLLGCLLEHILLRGNILLDQRLDLVDVILVLVLLLRDDMLFEPASAGGLSLFRRVKRLLLRLAISSETNLEMSCFFTSPLRLTVACWPMCIAQEPACWPLPLLHLA